MKIKGIVLMALSAIGYGFTPIFLKLAYAEGATLLQVQFWRFLMATALLWLVCLPAGVLKGLTLEDVPNLLKAGAGGGLLFACICLPQFTAMQYLSASVAEVLYFTYPVWVALASAAITKTRLRPGQWALLALLLGSVGVTLDFTGANFHALGVVLALVASVASACYILFGKLRMFWKYSGLQMGLCVMSGALVVFTLCYLFFEPDKRMLPGNAPLIVAGMAVLSTLVAMGSYFAGIKHLEPVQIATLAALEPVVTILAETFVLGVNLGMRTYIGAFLLIACITLFVIYRPRKGVQDGGTQNTQASTD